MTRLDLTVLAPRQHAAMARLDAGVELDPSLAELVKVRASQINGCAFCIDLHWQAAVAAGEEVRRLYALSAWWDAGLYTERERAALGLTEAITRITDGHVPDAVWEAAREQFDERELAQLVFAIVAINAWNRLAITTRLAPPVAV